MALSTRSNAANLLGGNAVKENELLARAGIKPRAALGGTGRTALSNLSNRAAIGAKLTGKPSTAAIDKENVVAVKRMTKTTGTTSLQSKLQEKSKPQNVQKLAPPAAAPAPRVPAVVREEPAAQKTSSPDKMDISASSQCEAFSQDMLPDSVRDIDTEDLDNPQLVAEYVGDIYAYMRHLEDKYKVERNYMEGTGLTARMRGILVDWLVQVHLRFHLLQETLYLTIAIIDRFLQEQSVKRDKLQLVGVTAMLIASKYEEMYAPEINDFVYITDSAYSKTEIRRMEIVILKTLQFNLGRPLPLHFLRRNSKAGEVNANTHSLAKYLMELTIVDYECAHMAPSLIAAAALCLSLKLLDEGDWDETLGFYSHYQEVQLVPVMCKMASLALTAGTGKLTAIKTKYASSKFLRISAIPELSEQSSRLREIAAGGKGQDIAGAAHGTTETPATASGPLAGAH